MISLLLYLCLIYVILSIYKTTLISHHVAGGVPMDTMKRTKVYSASDKYQAELILGILRNNDIPCFRQGVGSGSYMDIYSGNSVFGEDIYVDERDANAAKKLIYNTVARNENVDIAADEDISLNELNASKISVRAYAWIRTLLLILMILISVFLAIWRF